MKRSSMILMAISSIVMVGAGVSVWADGAREDIDVNRDGMYSFPELMSALPEMNEVVFGTLDANGDGLIGDAEIVSGVSAGVLPAKE